MTCVNGRKHYIFRLLLNLRAHINMSIILVPLTGYILKASDDFQKGFYRGFQRLAGWGVGRGENKLGLLILLNFRLSSSAQPTVPIQQRQMS